MKNYLLHVEYWSKSSKRDYRTMLGLFRIKRYSDSLFYGHIVLEKMLKALVVQKTKDIAPRTHDLNILADLAGMKIDKDDAEFLKTVTRFNIKTRYPDFKLNFYKACNFKYTSENIKKIKIFYLKLCQKVKLKKS